MNKVEPKVKVELTEGYRQRFTEACLEQLRIRKAKPEETKAQSERKTA